MGKRDDERIKLQATYYNNISVGLMIAAVFIPLLSIFSGTLAFFAALDRIANGILNVLNDRGASLLAEMAGSLPVLLGFFAALYASGKMRKAADDEIQKLDD